ncbi:MAG: acyl-CoA desaturase [Deltaproteobacteria bacterium]|nr:MAG: acyl-CoA desaturase [Deltaproteobacteria bacterium]
MYALRMFFVTAAYHRYFSHRAFKTSRWFQAVLAFMAETSSQKGILWWAAHHRDHHKYSDTPRDIHSPRQSGIWYAHVGWVLSDRTREYDRGRVPDLVRYPELVWLDRYWAVPVVAFAAAMFALGGWHGLVWGYGVSTVLLWHGTFTINSLSHVIGRRRYDTSDDSRNNAALALITLGEGWHNNHHHYQSSANQGFFWWEVDVTYYILRALAAAGIVWDLRKPPQRVLMGGRSRDASDADAASRAADAAAQDERAPARRAA